MDTVGRRIKKIRKIRGWTQRELAEMVGIHEMTMQSYELGYRQPREEQLKKLANALEVDISFFSPTKTDTPNAILALIFDLVNDYGDVEFAEQGDVVMFGVKEETDVLREAMEARARLTAEDFKKWLIDYPMG